MSDFQAIPTEFNGTAYRSRLEADMARVLTLLDIPFEYEPRSYLLSNGQHYRPDFVLACDAVIETRGYRSAESDRQVAEFMRRVAAGAPAYPRLFCALIAQSPYLCVAGRGRRLSGVADDLSPTWETRGVYEGGWCFRRLAGHWLPFSEDGLRPCLPAGTTVGQVAEAFEGPSVWLAIDYESGRLVRFTRSAVAREYPVRLPVWRSVRDCASAEDLIGGTA